MPAPWLRLTICLAAAAPLGAQGGTPQLAQRPGAATKLRATELSRAIAVARGDSAKAAMLRLRVDTTPTRKVNPAGVAVSDELLKRIAIPARADSQPRIVARAELERFFGAGAGQLKLVRNGKAIPISDTTTSLRIERGDGIFHKTGDAPAHLDSRALPIPIRALPVSGSVYKMPYRWLILDSAGVTRVLVPYLAIVGEGLTYNLAERRFTGSALVGVEDSLHAADGPQTLTTPLRLLLNTTNGGTLSKLQLAINHTSQSYDSIGVAAVAPMTIHLRTGADPAGIDFPVPLIAPHVGLAPDSVTIEAFGISTVDISVTLPLGMTTSDTATITLSATSASPSPSTVLVTAGKPAIVRLRSAAPGRDKITAYLDTVPVGEMTVFFGAPWMFLSATLIGVFLGGLARFVSAKRRKRASALWYDLLKGFPFGVIAAAASAVGLDLVGLGIKEPGAWIAVMLIASVGAWMGSRLLDGRTAAPKAE
ncbi:MAG: hypothetical protein ABJD07_04580 [Gemmatimonadaceae bacterium]